MEFSAECVSSIGLGLDMVGVVLLFFFGLPGKVDPEGRSYRTTSEVDQGEIKKGRLYKRLSNVGLALLLIGFGLQLISNWI